MTVGGLGRQFLREPLLHFVVLGIAIFVVYEVFRGDGPGDNEIVVTRGHQQNLIATFERTWQRSPSPQEYQVLVEDFIRQEIAYREAGAMELDRNDIIIRRRLRQKLELLTEDLSSLVPPTEVELETYYDENVENYRTSPRYTFTQIFFSSDDSVELAKQRAAALLANIATGEKITDPANLGDRISLPVQMRDSGLRDVASTFGSEFAEQLYEFPMGVWAGPIRSAYGLHLVNLETRLDGFVPPLADISSDVRNDFLYQRRSEAVDTLYESLAERYTIDIESLVETAGSE